ASSGSRVDLRPRVTPSIFAPVSTPAFAIRELSFLVLAIVTFIFIVVAGLTVYAIIRYRRRPGDDGREPPQVYGSTQIELAWTVVIRVLRHDPRNGRIINAVRPAAMA